MKREYHAPLECNRFYHLYNRGNNKENLFREDRNYHFFLGKWEKYLEKYVDTWAYCLMPNHFHFLIKVKNTSFFPEGTEVNKLLEGQFKRLFSSYTLSFNKVYDRTGSLFQKRFKRVSVNSQRYLLTLIHYIHHNPIHHKFSGDYTDWPFSSYQAIIGPGVTKVCRADILELFGSKESFINFHSQLKDYKKIRNLIIE